MFSPSACVSWKRLASYREKPSLKSRFVSSELTERGRSLAGVRSDVRVGSGRPTRHVLHRSTLTPALPRAAHPIHPGLRRQVMGHVKPP